MNAIQPVRRTSQPTPIRRKTSHPPQRKQRPLQRHPHRAIALELSTKLAVNVVIITASVSALIKLLPYNVSHQSKLQELRTEVALVETRVDRLRLNFHRYFDPQQSMSVMQEQSDRVSPDQRRIIWLHPKSSTQFPAQHP